ncbi:hypothetical protein ACLOJK_010712 [Asimina triloba]
MIKNRLEKHGKTSDISLVDFRSGFLSEMETTDPAILSRRRLAVLSAHLSAAPFDGFSPVLEASAVSAQEIVRPPGNLKGSMTVIDERTGKKYEIQVSEEGTVRATDLKKSSVYGILLNILCNLTFGALGACDCYASILKQKPKSHFDYLITSVDCGIVQTTLLHDECFCWSQKSKLVSGVIRSFYQTSTSISSFCQNDCFEVLPLFARLDRSVYKHLEAGRELGSHVFNGNIKKQKLLLEGLATNTTATRTSGKRIYGRGQCYGIATPTLEDVMAKLAKIQAHMARFQTDLEQITTGKYDKGLKLYDPGYLNTAPVYSKICYIDGDEGILRYRGYPIEELAESSSFLEVAYLLMYGNLPSQKMLVDWEFAVSQHSAVPQGLLGQPGALSSCYVRGPGKGRTTLGLWPYSTQPYLVKQEIVSTTRTRDLQFAGNFVALSPLDNDIIQAMPHDAHPMGVLVSAMSALSVFHPDANPALRGQDLYESKQVRDKQIVRIIGKATTIAAAAYLRLAGRPPVLPSNNLSYAENFLYMLDSL